MTTLNYILCAVSKLPSGETPVHMYIGVTDPTGTDSPGDERRALKDAKHVLQDILDRNVNGDELQLLQDGEPPYDAMPIFTFSIGVSWDREHMMAHYSKIGYGRCVNQKLFNPVYSLAMDLYEETFSILRKRERKDCQENGGIRLKNDPVTEKIVRERYEEWHRTSLKKWLERFSAHEANNPNVHSICPSVRVETSRELTADERRRVIDALVKAASVEMIHINKENEND